MSYDLGRYGATANRALEPDYNLSPRELYQYGPSLWQAMQEKLAGRPVQRSLATELSEACAQRSGLSNVSGRERLCIPTDVPAFRPSRLDIGKRAAAPMVVGTDNIGGYLRATENISFIEMLRNRSVVFQMGAKRLSGLVGNTNIPKQSAAATAYWLATETTAITVSQQTLAQLPLTPRTVGATSQISRLLALQSSPDIQGLVMADLATVVALAVDLAAMRGTGTEQPQGIIGTASVGTFSGTSLASTGLIKAQTDVATANALSASCGYVFTPAVAALLMDRAELTGSGQQRIWQGSLIDGTIYGFRAMASNQLASATGIFGAWDQLVIGEWGVLELAINPFSDFEAGISAMRAMYTVDVGVRNAGAFSTTISVT